MITVKGIDLRDNLSVFIGYLELILKQQMKQDLTKEELLFFNKVYKIFFETNLRMILYKDNLGFLGELSELTEGSI